jgi:thiol-disulfide isomerase/thioredoxin
MNRHLLRVGAIHPGSIVLALLLAFQVELYGQEKGDADEPAPKPRPFVVELVDTAGKPVEGASVGIMAAVGKYIRDRADKDKTEWYYLNHVRSDADGIARCVDDDDYLERLCLIARHEGRKIAAVASVDLKRPDKPIKLTLVPERQLVGKVTCPELAAIKHGAVTYVRHAGKLMLECEFETGEFSLSLPPGDYEIRVYGSQTHILERGLQVRDEPAVQHIEPFELRATQLALLEGKPAPEIPGIVGWKNSKPLKLADLHGKCVLLEFWGYWCGPCIFRMPELFELYDKHHKAGLEVIGIHVDLGADEENPVNTAAKLDERLTDTRKNLWKGRDLPFPVALVSGDRVPFGEGLPGEARGLAAARYGVIFYPTQVLIDRQGNVVGRFIPNEEGFAQLERLLRKK